MTTHPPTGAEEGSARPGIGAFDARLPDESVLNAMASQLFSALPITGTGVTALAPVAPAESTPAPTPVRSSAAGTGAVPPGGPTSLPEVPDFETDDEVPGAGRTPSMRAPDPTAIPSHPSPGPVPPAWIPSLPAPRALDPRTSAGSTFYFLDHAAAPSAPVGASPYYFLDTTTMGSAVPVPPFDVHAVRNDFPILRERVNGHPLVWFDNAATTQKPRAVIDRLAYFYEHENSNIHRAAHELAARSTDAYEQARATVARFLGASSSEEIIFVRGATEGINLIAQTWGRANVGAGDQILISHLEHHANIVPWQMLAAEKGAELVVAPVDDDGALLLDEFAALLTERTKLVSVTHVSNALGTITPVRDIVALAHRAGATVLIDGAQSVPHTRVDLRDLDADFFVFSGHKLFGPTGIGVVYGSARVLRDMPPWQGGGNMISDVTLERSLFQPPPGRFEAGTGNIADAVGLGAAIEYVERLGIAAIAAYEHQLLDYATPRLAAVPGVRLVGTAPEKASVLSFVIDGIDPLDIGKALNEKGIAVRAGHHCAQPILRRLGLEATVRPSFAFYNTCEEIDRMIATLWQFVGARPPRHG